jgi:hypothetical protein
MPLCVSHRFSTTRHADRILVLDGGRLIEHGTDDELIARDGVYAELFELQAASYRWLPGARSSGAWRGVQSWAAGASREELDRDARLPGAAWQMISPGRPPG